MFVSTLLSAREKLQFALFFCNKIYTPACPCFCVTMCDCSTCNANTSPHLNPHLPLLPLLYSILWITQWKNTTITSHYDTTHYCFSYILITLSISSALKYYGRKCLWLIDKLLYSRIPLHIVQNSIWLKKNRTSENEGNLIFWRVESEFIVKK